MIYLVDSLMVETDVCLLHRALYRAVVRRSLALECGTCSGVGMVVDGRSMTRCPNRLRTDPRFCMNCYTYCVLHNDLHEDINTT